MDDDRVWLTIYDGLTLLEGVAEQISVELCAILAQFVPVKQARRHAVVVGSSIVSMLFLLFLTELAPLLSLVEMQHQDSAFDLAGLV